MLPKPSPRATPTDRHAGVNRANVIKWMQALPVPQRESGPPGRPDRAAPRRKEPCRAPDHPLPDPALARLCAVPESAPPYDDEVLAEVKPMFRQTGPARTPLAAQTTRPGPAPTPRRPGATPAAPATPPTPRRPRATPPTPPTPPWPSQFAQVLAETLAGTRSSHQLTPWTTERARGHIRRLGPLLSASQQPRIRRVVASEPASGIVELSVVVNFGPRVRALAVRLERTEHRTGDQSWLCTAIEAA